VRWRTMDYLDDQADGLEWDNGYRGFLNRGGWPSPERYGMGMDRYDGLGEGRRLNLGVGSPRLGEWLGRGMGVRGLGIGSPRLGEGLGERRDELGLGARVYDREGFDQPLGALGS